ncbi:DUF362 domain-containing protein [Desulfocurvus sp. DL9XJH121]
MRDLVSVGFASFEASVPEVLDACGAGEFLAGRERVLLKPNLVMAKEPPVTTPVALTEAVARYVRAHAPGAEIVVAEGTGCGLETGEVFERLGYAGMAARLGLPLVDLNHAPLVRRENPACRVFPEMWLPELAFTHTVVSLPVLKAHSLSTVTGTMKNMMGFAPPEHYGGGSYGAWKKARFHQYMHQSIRDLCAYVSPALTLMDASVGMAEYHLGGPVCDPPVGLLLAGAVPLALDREAARLLGLDWRTIGHLAE